MKNKHPNAIAVLALGLAMAGLHLADLLLWTDADTGFATAGSVWLRYIPWLAALALPCLPRGSPACGSAGYLPAARHLHGADRRCAGRRRFFRRQCRHLRRAVPRVLLRRLPGVGGLGGFSAAGFLRRLAAVLRRAGVQRLRHAAPTAGPPAVGRGRAAVLPLEAALALSVHPLPRSIGCPAPLRILSAAAALLLAVVLLKVFLVPGLPCGHTLFAAGTGAFLLCTGLELPQTLFEAARGMLVLPDLLTGIGIGLFGLCGLVCAWQACGDETE